MWPFSWCLNEEKAPAVYSAGTYNSRNGIKFSKVLNLKTSWHCGDTMFYDLRWQCYKIGALMGVRSLITLDWILSKGELDFIWSLSNWNTGEWIIQSIGVYRGFLWFVGEESIGGVNRAAERISYEGNAINQVRDIGSLNLEVSSEHGEKLLYFRGKIISTRW